MSPLYRFFLPLVFVLNACVSASTTNITSRSSINYGAGAQMKTFTMPTPTRTHKSNAELATDFIELAFHLESGTTLPLFTRFEGPITLRVTGAPPPTLGPDLAKLLFRLRREANINISEVSAARPANVTIQAVSRRAIQRILPHAACFVAPNVSSLTEYRKIRNTPKASWRLLVRREKLAIFVPNDASPQEVRDCLHEELAQALGPLNDLYRLPDSVFNDDNIHTILTGFDMMILKAYYSPELRSGMTREKVARALPAIFDRINPNGRGGIASFPSQTPRAFSLAIQVALGPGSRPAQRVDAAKKALQIAKSKGWTDNRRAFAHYANGRILLKSNPKRAHLHFLSADQFYRSTPGTALHRAYVATQLAAFALTSGDGTYALSLIDPNIPIAARNENAVLLSTLLLLRAEALEITGRNAEARAVRLDSLGWARYGFGPEWAVRAKVREISALPPRRGGLG